MSIQHGDAVNFHINLQKLRPDGCAAGFVRSEESRVRRVHGGKSLLVERLEIDAATHHAGTIRPGRAQDAVKAFESEPGLRGDIAPRESL